MGDNTKGSISPNDTDTESQSVSQLFDGGDFIGYLNGREQEGGSDPDATNDDDSNTNSRPHFGNTLNKTKNKNNKKPKANAEDSSFKNNVVGKAATAAGSTGAGAKFISKFANRNKSKMKGSGKGSTHAPLIAIIIALFGSAGAMTGLNQLLPAHLQTAITRAVDVQHPSMTGRSFKIFRHKLKKGKISKRLAQRLNDQGIKVGQFNSYGEFQAIDPKDIKNIRGQDIVLQYKDKNINSKNLRAEMAKDIEFTDLINKAKRGRIADMMDFSALKEYAKHNLHLNRFSRHRREEAGVEDGDHEAQKDFVEDTLAEKPASENDIDLGKINAELQKEYDQKLEEYKKKYAEWQKGGEKGDPPVAPEPPKLEATNPDVPAGDADSKSDARVKADKYIESISAGVDGLCSLASAFTTVAVTYGVIQSSRAIVYAITTLEPMSATMSGEDNGIPINPILNRLTRPTKAEITYYDKKKGENVTETTEGSQLEAPGLLAQIADAELDPEELAPYTISSIMGALNAALASVSISKTACASAEGVLAIVSIASNFIPGGPIASGAMKVTGKVIMKTLGKIAISGAIAVVIPKIGKALGEAIIPMFVKDISEYQNGIAGGNLLAQGSASSAYNTAKSGSAMMPSSADRVDTQNQNMHIANIAEAEANRRRLSPFDLSSSDTFLGSILTKFALSAGTTIPSSLQKVAHTISQSAQSLIPKTSAAEEATEKPKFTGSYQACTELKDAVCDGFGNPIPANDPSTSDISPDDPKYQRIVNEEIKDGEIVKNSNLDKFVNYCVNRQAPWGVLDQNILDQLASSGSEAIDSISGAVGDILLDDVNTLLELLQDEVNRGWATGEYCVNSPNNPNWEEYKYYQRFYEDSRINFNLSDEGASEEINKRDINSISAIEASADLVSHNDGDLYEGPMAHYTLLAQEARHLEEFPEDNSDLGVLARYTGRRKEDLIADFKLVKEAIFIANYDPSDSYRFNQIAPEHNLIALESKTLNSEQSEAEHYTRVIFQNPSLQQNYIFTDKRNYLL